MAAGSDVFMFGLAASGRGIFTSRGVRVYLHKGFVDLLTNAHTPLPRHPPLMRDYIYLLASRSVHTHTQAMLVYPSIYVHT